MTKNGETRLKIAGNVRLIDIRAGRRDLNFFDQYPLHYNSPLACIMRRTLSHENTTKLLITNKRLVRFVLELFIPFHRFGKIFCPVSDL